MASSPDHISMALFCDFENVALGVRDANYEKFDIKRVLERLLLKGSIVVKKAYCDWERYKGFKSAMHEANFELIEIPHVRQSGKNSADIRLVVDALDLCYTKSHVNTFVIISGDSDFSPLVSKLRENAKYVIGVGVKQSTSDLLIANCDEFIFYDDLVRESQRQRRDNRGDQNQPRRTPEEEARRKAEMEARRTKAVEMAVETYEALVTDRDEGGRIWASVLKEAIKRRNPGFNENYYGFRTFGNLLEDAQGRGLLDFGRDEKSGAFVTRSSGPAPSLMHHPADMPVAAQPVVPPSHGRLPAEDVTPADVPATVEVVAAEASAPAGSDKRKRPARKAAPRQRNRGKQAEAAADAEPTAPTPARVAEQPAAPARQSAPNSAVAEPATEENPNGTPPAKRKTGTGTRRPRKPSGKTPVKADSAP